MNLIDRRNIVSALACTLLGACTGIPMRSLPRLIALRTELMTAQPAEIMLAIQIDASMVPPAGATPTLNIDVRPERAGSFEPITRQLPLQLSVSQAPPGLASAGNGRRWMVYSLTAASQAELARIQQRFEQLRAQRPQHGGGSLSIGIAQEGLASDDPRLAHSTWESWLQTSTRAGFFELWSGTLAQLKAQAHAQNPVAARP